MNKTIFTCIVAICCMTVLPSATVSTKTESGKKSEKILLEKETGTRPSETAEVITYTNGDILSVVVEN